MIQGLRVKKNIVHFITGLNTGGAEIMLLKLLSAINLNKYNILVISLIDKGTIGHKIESLGIEVLTLNLSRKSPVTLSLLSLPFILKRFKPNIFHGWMYHANLLLSLTSLLFPKVRIIWGIRHSLYDINKEKFLTRLVIYLSKFFSKKCTNIIFNSIISLEQHVKYGFSDNNCSVIHNGFDTKKFSPDNFTEKQRNILRTQLKIPENTNFAIKSTTAKSFAESNNIRLISKSSYKNKELGEYISNGTYYLSCMMTLARIKEMQTQKVFFQNIIK